jgi:hypothetical protein
MNADHSYVAPTLAADYPTIAAEVRQAAPQLFKLLGIRFVTLDLEKSPPLLVKLVEEALPVRQVDQWSGPDWTGAPSTIRLYAVDPLATTTPLSMDIQTSAAQMYLAEGWSPIGVAGAGRYATRPTVDLLLPRMPKGAHLSLTFGKPTRVKYEYEGQPIGEQQGLTHTIALPPQANGGDNNEATTRLTLNFEDPAAPISALVPNASPIGTTGVSLAPGHAILVQSAGEEVGNFAHLWIDGVDYANSARGYNLVALTPDGKVLSTATFDTMTSGHSALMATWLQQWAEGTIVAGAGADSVADDGGAALDENTIVALQKLGVTGDLRGKFRWSHAFIGVAGTPKGSAVETVQLIRPAAVWLGAPLTAAGYGPLLHVTVTEN